MYHFSQNSLHSMGIYFFIMMYSMNAKKATDPHYVEWIKPYYEVRTKTPLVEGEGEDNETTNFNIIIKPTSVVCKKSIP